MKPTVGFLTYIDDIQVMTWGTSHYLHRRHSGNDMESSPSLSTPPSDTRWFGTSRFFGELHKVGHLPSSGNRLSGVGSELENNDCGSPRREDSQVPNKDNYTTLLIKVFTCQPSSIACLIGLLSASIQAITVGTYRG